MKTISLLAGLVAAACIGQAAAATSNSYYLVVPVKGRQADAGNINVSLAGYTLPQAQVGKPYEGFDFNTLLTVTGDASYSGYGVAWSVASGQLPEGMSLSSTGVLTGTPTTAGTESISLRATYKTKRGLSTYQVVVVSGITVTLAAGTAPEAIVGQAYSYDLKSRLAVSGDNAYTGSGVTWTVVSSTLPAGLSLRVDGTIAGTPTAASTGSVTARATYRGVDGEQTYQVVTLGINVQLGASTAPQGKVGQPYAYSLIQLLSVKGDPSYRGSGVTWTVVSSSLPAGLYLTDMGTIAGTPTASGTGTITARATYRGVNGEQTYQVVTTGVEVSLMAATPPQAIVGQAYSYDLRSLLTVVGDDAYTGNGVSWSLVSSTLPAGLTLRADGTIAGTATAGGTGKVTARATYNGVNGEQTYEIVTLDIKVTLAPAPMPKFNVDGYTYVDMRNQLAVLGDPAYSWVDVTWTKVGGTLPAGLSVLPAGAIAGTPTTSGTSDVTVRATYRGISSEQTYQVVVLSVEDDVPGPYGGTGDGNGDGIQDSQQVEVASLRSVMAGTPFVTFAVDSGYTLTGIKALPSPTGLPRNVKMPMGRYSFTIGNVAPGGTVVVSQYTDAGYGINGYFMQDAGSNWINVATSVTQVGSKNKVTFSITDGGPFDRDNTANGVIVAQ